MLFVALRFLPDISDIISNAKGSGWLCPTHRLNGRAVSDDLERLGMTTAGDWLVASHELPRFVNTTKLVRESGLATIQTKGVGVVIVTVK